MTTAVAQRRPGVVRRVAHVMGMPISLALRGRAAGTFEGEAAWAETMATLRDVDRVFSPFRTDSVISRLDRGEIDLMDAPPEVAEVLGLAEQARIESHGAFDVRRHGRLDPCGIVKGWAVDRAARPLRHLGDTDFCLSAGGDLVAYVAADDRPAWRIGIEDPHELARVVATVPVRDGAVATSGLARRGAHLTDPRTGSTPTALASVTVIAEDLTTADVDATAAFVLASVGEHWLQSRGRSAVVVHRDGRVAEVRR
ncbi:FAD:protein FMN transferase [Nocardioides sp. Kera G14]|uniref:FAD:protein FMN transferase n=1 Tax=Nocardioides sp. Kera G14 TaxID=2884264 RepID=UPI001D120A68|nr:FAD:protein FMN transferase [Nocardioides sp. Kera G14]UDY23436.1 FAD:protein FMN transferase [Nocardioides sp. Kera G14]